VRAIWDYPESALKNEGVELFRPIHNVFGHQTGLEASNDPGIFKEAYNNSIERYWSFTRSEKREDNWQKEWESVIPRGEGDTYRVRDVAEWLWNRFVADGLINFGTLERAHVYSLLGSGNDFGYFVDSTDATRTYTEDEIERYDQPSADIDGLTSIERLFGAIAEWMQAGSSSLVFPQIGTSDLEPGVDFSSLFIS
jgi:hypothetical protein